MPDFNSKNLKARSAFESLPGVSPAAGATWHDQPVVSEGLSGSPDDIELASLTGDLYDAESLDGKAEVSGEIATEFDTENHIVPLAVAMRGSAAVANPTAGVYEHRMSADSGQAIDYPRTFVQGLDRDDGEPLFYRGGRPSSVVIGAESGGVVTMSYTTSFESYDSFPAPTVVSDTTANTHQPVLRGLPRFDLRDPDVDNDIFVQVSAIGSLPASFDVLCKVGTAASYGATASTVYVGTGDDGRPNWSGQLVDSTSGAPIGTGELPLEIWQQSNTGIEVGDEWEWPNPGTGWTPAVSAAPKLNATASQVWLDNRAGTLAKTCWGSWQVTLTPPFGEKPCGEGRWRQYDDFGSWSAEIAVSKTYESLLYRHMRDNSQTFALRFLAKSADPISGAYHHQIQIDCPKVKLTGETVTIGGPDRPEEALAARCLPGSNLGYTAPVTVTLTNTIASLTA